MESKAQRRVLQHLKLNGPQKTDAIASALKVSKMAIHQHLDAMADEGLVAFTQSQKGVGRPAKIWNLTSAADAFFPHGYAELTTSLIDLLRQTFGEDGLQKIIATRTDEQISQYRAQIPDDLPIAEKLEKLAEIRTSEGYMASVETDMSGYWLLENHCPICAAASTCQGLCASELDLFQSILGEGVIVERREHILKGAHRCAYFITAK